MTPADITLADLHMYGIPDSEDIIEVYIEEVYFVLLGSRTPTYTLYEDVRPHIYRRAEG